VAVLVYFVFDIQGAVFILAADREQLKNSAKTAFGPNLDFEEYYRKFIHREVALPPISDDGYKQLNAAYLDHYLEKDGLRNCFMDLNSAQTRNIHELAAALKLTSRQIQEVFRILGHIFATTNENKGRLRWCLAAGSIAMAALKVGDSVAYRLLGHQEFEPQKALGFLRELLPDGRGAEWWFKLFLTGGGVEL